MSGRHIYDYNMQAKKQNGNIMTQDINRQITGRNGQIIGRNGQITGTELDSNFFKSFFKSKYRFIPEISIIFLFFLSIICILIHVIDRSCSLDKTYICNNDATDCTNSSKASLSFFIMGLIILIFYISLIYGWSMRSRTTFLKGTTEFRSHFENLKLFTKSGSPI